MKLLTDSGLVDDVSAEDAECKKEEIMRDISKENARLRALKQEKNDEWSTGLNLFEAEAPALTINDVERRGPPAFAAKKISRIAAQEAEKNFFMLKSVRYDWVLRQRLVRSASIVSSMVPLARILSTVMKDLEHLKRRKGVMGTSGLSIQTPAVTARCMCLSLRRLAS